MYTRDATHAIFLVQGVAELLDHFLVVVILLVAAGAALVAIGSLCISSCWPPLVLAPRKLRTAGHRLRKLRFLELELVDSRLHIIDALLERGVLSLESLVVALRVLLELVELLFRLGSLQIDFALQRRMFVLQASLLQRKNVQL